LRCGSPHAGGGATPGVGGMYCDTSANIRAMKSSGGQVEERDYATGLEDPQHLARGDLRPRCEHMAELAEYDIECAVGIGQRLDVTLQELDRSTDRRCVSPRVFEQHRRQSQTARERSLASGGDRHDTSS